MNLSTLRVALLGMGIGLLVALAPSCGKKCGPDTCSTGCCNAKNECVGGTDTATCGKGGASCSACSGTDTCTDGACTPVMVMDAGQDAGEVDAGPPPCVTDDDCSYLKTGKRCAMDGQCVDGRGCNFDSDCSSEDSADYCYRFGVQCRCVTSGAGAPSGYSGVCHRRKAACDECTTDSECGDGLLFTPQGKCAALPGDSSGKKYCRQQPQGSCPCGLINDGNGYCIPQNGSCATKACSKDGDCGAGTVCNSTTCGICVARCRWDFDKKAVASPGCPPGKTCWVDSANLKPDSPYYGSGRCQSPCTGEDDCTRSDAGNPFGGPNLTCRAEQTSAGLSEKRCRAKGECMDNLECPQAPPTEIYLGYCDRGTFECKNNTCRVGNDVLTGTPYKDCRAPYSCASDAGTNYCRLLTCAEQGGAAIACSRGQYCCGEDKDGDGKADPCPPKSEQDQAGCYMRPAPPFCQMCMSDEDCKNIQLPAYLSGSTACANGSRSPSCSPLPLVCLYGGNKGMQMGVNACAPATFNDKSRDSNGLGKDVRGCPAQYPPILVRPKFAQGDDFCNNDTDCNQGGSDAGRCAPDMTTSLQDGGHPKACICKAGMGDNQCPNSEDGGFLSVCGAGVSGATVSCVRSVVCMPGPQVLYALPDAGGCGL
ncbi:MAG: hypothetical protein K1X89_30415 [Myxococcaceae bacterium]|nr:hypothetical protein [Myxococcaceae bacterium]